MTYSKYARYYYYNNIKCIIDPVYRIMDFYINNQYFATKFY